MRDECCVVLFMLCCFLLLVASSLKILETFALLVGKRNQKCGERRDKDTKKQNKRKGKERKTGTSLEGHITTSQWYIRYSYDKPDMIWYIPHECDQAIILYLILWKEGPAAAGSCQRRRWRIHSMMGHDTRGWIELNWIEWNWMELNSGCLSLNLNLSLSQSQSHPSLLMQYSGRHTVVRNWIWNDCWLVPGSAKEGGVGLTHSDSLTRGCNHLYYTYV